MNIREIQLQDKARDFNWILEHFERGRLYVSGILLRGETFEKFRLFVKTTEEIYIGLWDLEIGPSPFTPEGLDIKSIVIHFPELVISNSTGATHNITDLFVKVHLMVDHGELKVTHLSGGRQSISYQEYCSRYFHSHVPGSYTVETTSIESPFYSSFCRGSGHINDFIADINSEGVTEERLISFLVQITGLVSWESLEGGPHRRIGDINSRSRSGSQSRPRKAHIDSLYRTVLEHCKDNKIIPEIDFKLESNLYRLVDNNKIEKFLTETVELPIELKKEVICTRGIDGLLYKFGMRPGIVHPENAESVRPYIFQGREIPFVVEAPPSEDEMTIEYFLNPTVTKEIINKIEYDINIKKIRESTIERYSNKGSSTRESVESDKVAM